MRIIKVSDGFSSAKELRGSSPGLGEALVNQTRSIFDDIALHGDAALHSYTSKFDNVSLNSFIVTPEEISNSYSRVPPAQVKAVKLARKALIECELALLERLKGIRINTGGVLVQRDIKPIDSVGCYVPGGKARYPSTLVMCSVPAKIAGVKRIVAISPPMKDGSIDPLTLVAADICGVDEFYKIGGAQGIAALAFGTETIKPVSKIVGPGGMFVTASKLIASSRVSTDMVAGPTELLVYCDERSNARLVALDLISQAEHSPDTLCGLVTTSEAAARCVISEISTITSLPGLPRAEIIKKSLEQNGFAAVCENSKAAIDFINEFAPEHLQIASKNSASVAAQVRSAGLVLLGEDSPSAASDYSLGSNHVLPTLGFAKSRGSLSVLDFIKVVNIVKASKPALAKVDQSIASLTEAEGLLNHYSAVRARLIGSNKKKTKGQKKPSA